MKFQRIKQEEREGAKKERKGKLGNGEKRGELRGRVKNKKKYGTGDRVQNGGSRISGIKK